MSSDKVSQLPEKVSFTGRILFLTEDTSLIRQQLEAQGAERARIEAALAERLINDDLPLMSNISTDEITPGWVCFYYDETLGEYVYVGMREGVVKKDEVKQGGFAVVVSGLSKGCGSSRETAPYAEKWAGIQLVIAKSIEKIYGQSRVWWLVQLQQGAARRQSLTAAFANKPTPDDDRRKDYREACICDCRKDWC